MAAPDFLHLSIAFALTALAGAGLALIRPSSTPSDLKFQTLWLTVTPFVVFVFLIVSALAG